MLEVKTPVDLEGKYLAFEFSADYTEGTCLVILLAKDGKLEDAFHHGGDLMPETSRAITYLRRKDIRKVYIFTGFRGPNEVLDMNTHVDNGDKGFFSYDTPSEEYLDELKSAEIDVEAIWYNIPKPSLSRLLPV